VGKVSGRHSASPRAAAAAGRATMATSTTAVGGVRLAQEIHDEFLVCKICLDSYRSPKCLSCLHTFCEQCIDNHVNSESSYKKYSDYREFTCPLCRKRTQLPVGGVKKLPDNFLVSSLTEVTPTVSCTFVSSVNVLTNLQYVKCAVKWQFYLIRCDIL